MQNKLFFGVLLMSAVVSGCKVDVSDYEPKELELHRYAPKYSCEEISIKKDDEIYRFVKKLLSENREGWHPSIVHYVPQVKVRADNDMYRLNICSNILVVMYWDSEKKHTTQVVKRVSSEAYDEIVALVEISLQNAGSDNGSELKEKKGSPP
ncbi:MAG TPA: hypothetical protein PLD51_04145 [Pontiellaceae bacterium]|nr:hypothetical protein [Pontiellaceae bacterium]HPR83030.1 hypothetical protein [Pontiellaceae bacterium]